MKYELRNQQISISVDSLGAQLVSLKSEEGIQYLWQGDPAFWKGQAPVLFPWVGRLQDSSYQVDGKVYQTGIHGFAKTMEFACTEQTEHALTFTLEANQETLRQYPFRFRFSVRYALEGTTLHNTFRVENTGEETMYFGLGGHPGFHVPLTEGEEFSDYVLTFPEPCRPDRILFTENVLYSGQTAPYPLENDRQLTLSHGLFDEDAIFLTHMARSVTLRGKAGRGVKVDYPDMSYLGLWHMPKTEAPYVCIEPWLSLPGRDGILENLRCRSDLVSLQPGKTYENTISITVF